MFISQLEDDTSDIEDSDDDSTSSIEYLLVVGFVIWFIHRLALSDINMCSDIWCRGSLLYDDINMCSEIRCRGCDMIDRFN